jgi:UDP-N-acetylmuramyl tripeptide synthase
VCLGNLFRDQLDRYGELEQIAERWLAAVRELPESSTLVLNADDPQVGSLASERSSSVTFGLDDPAQARPSLQHAADSKYCLRCGLPYAYAPPVGHLGTTAAPRAAPRAPRLDVAARSIAWTGSAALLRARDTRRREAHHSSALPGLYNVYNAVGAASLALVSVRLSTTSSRASRASAPPSAASSASASAIAACWCS